MVLEQKLKLGAKGFKQFFLNSQYHQGRVKNHTGNREKGFQAGLRIEAETRGNSFSNISPDSTQYQQARVNDINTGNREKGFQAGFRIEAETRGNGFSNISPDSTQYQQARVNDINNGIRDRVCQLVLDFFGRYAIYCLVMCSLVIAPQITDV